MTAGRALRALGLGALAAAGCSGPTGPGHSGMSHGGAPGLGALAAQSRFDDLGRRPHGPAQSLRAPGKGGEAAAVDTRFRTARAWADVAVSASRD